MNDAEREEWVMNDEGLYDLLNEWRRKNKGGVRGFIRANRSFIDVAIGYVLSGEKPAHHLKYGPHDR